MIVCLGDSITYGQLLEPELAWPALVEGYDLWPAAVPGDTTRLGLERFPKEVQAPQPEAVILQFGHNDANRWLTDKSLPRVQKKAFKANLEEMIIRCKRFRITPFLCTLTPTFKSQRYADDCKGYDETIRMVAESKDVRLIDVRLAFFRHPTGSKSLLLPDMLHLNADGQAVFANTVKKALDDWKAEDALDEEETEEEE